MAVYSYEGVEYEFMDTQKRFLEELKCPICLELVSDPVQTSCGHLFCGKCIKETETCPVDRKQFTTTPDHFNERRLGDFKVKCPNKGRGCLWQGDLGDAGRHTDVNCEYQVLGCNNAGCDVRVKRGHLADHMQNECLLRMQKCPYCNKEDTFFNLKETKTHFTTCNDVPLPCPGGCGRLGLMRRNMAQHLSTECPEELVACTFVIAGCQQIVKRKDLQQHLQDKDQHLDTVLSSYVSVCILLRDLAYAIKFGNHDNIQALLLPLPFRSWLYSTPTCYPRPPWVIKMEGFQEKKESNEEWFSEPVYSHFGGYKMRLKVSTNRIGRGGHAYVIVLIYWEMRGNNERSLKWPFNGTIKVTLLNQLEDRQHHTKLLWAPDDIQEDGDGHVTERERGRSGWGYSHFISHQNLSYCGTTVCQFLKNDTLFFRVDRFEPT